MILNNDGAVLFDEARRHFGGDQASRLLFGGRSLHEHARHVDFKPLVAILDVKIRLVTPLLGAMDEAAVSGNGFSPDQRERLFAGLPAELTLETIPNERASRNAIT